MIYNSTKKPAVFPDGLNLKPRHFILKAYCLPARLLLQVVLKYKSLYLSHKIRQFSENGVYSLFGFRNIEK